MPQPVTYRGMSLVVPDNDSEWNEYFALARQHRLMVRACTACRLMRYPPTHACPWCMELGWRWQELDTLWDVDRPEDYERLRREGWLDALPR